MTISQTELKKIGEYIFDEITDGEPLDGDDIEQLKNYLDELHGNIEKKSHKHDTMKTCSSCKKYEDISTQDTGYCEKRKMNVSPDAPHCGEENDEPETN